MAADEASPNTLANAAFVAACLAILVAPIAQMVRPFVDEAPLHGVVAPAARPAASLAGVTSEAYQRDFKAWFEQSFGLRRTLVRLDNSIEYWILDEARQDKEVQVGPDKTLFIRGQLVYHDVATTDPEPSLRVARRTKRAGDALRAQGKVLVTIVLPSKAPLFADAIPRGWDAPLGEPRPNETMVYRPFVDELARQGALFVDGPRVLERYGREDRAFLYARTGRHLNAPAACILFEAALELARPLLPDRTIPHLDCTFEMRVPQLGDEELDLFELLNVWAPLPKVATAMLHDVPEVVPEADRADLLVVGSSFAGRFLREAHRNHAFRSTHFYYYNKHVEELGKPLQPMPKSDSPEWRALTFSKSVYVLPVAQEFLPEQDSEPFLRQILEASGVSDEP
jgi:hypothetical protein